MPEDLVPFYSESARRAIFFSKFEASKLKASQVEPEHLLLGILRESAEPLKKLAGDARIALEKIRQQFDDLRGSPHPEAEELPFSSATEEILRIGAKGRNPDQSATTIDLLHAMLLGPESRAREALESSGLTLSTLEPHRGL